MCEKIGRQINIPKKEKTLRNWHLAMLVCYSLSNAKPLSETEGMDIEDKLFRDEELVS